MALKKIRTILVGVATPDERSQPAVERAATLAEAFRAQVILFHSAFESYLSGRPFFDSQRLAKSRAELVESRQHKLENVCKKLEQRGITARAAVVWEEPAYAALIRAGIRDDADLIVIGAHRPRANRTPVLKQNDWELMRYSSRPLLIVRKPRSEIGPVVAALDPNHANDKPAVLDVEIARSAATLAAGLNTELHAAHCVADSAFPLGPISNKDRNAKKKEMQAQMRVLLDDARVDARKIHVAEGLVETALPELLATLEAHTLVLGALSRRWLEGFVVGNTAERLVHETNCDLLIIKPPDFKVRLPRVRKQSVAHASSSRRPSSRGR